MRADATASCLSRSPDAFSAQRLERVFARCFADHWRTRLVGGADEPLYQPARSPGEHCLLHYRADYFASALHEVAHWCIAGQRRRALPDFGYWYAADGRNAQQQQAFEAVEFKPQALEWWFSKACGYPFQVSTDNLDGPTGHSSPFKARILAQALTWRSTGLPPRADQFAAELGLEFGIDFSPGCVAFSLAELA